MYEAEDAHWWYVASHERFLCFLNQYGILKNDIAVLDAGCGTARWLELLKSTYNIREAGIDFEPKALELAKNRGDFNLILGDINNALFAQHSFDLITSFDVMCNKNIDDIKVIKHFNNYLKENACLLISLPAYNFLKSKHDKVVHTGKRYTKKQLKILLSQNGFDIIKITYCVSFLFPFALIKRLTDKLFIKKSNEHNEVKIPPIWINKLFLALMRIENKLLKNFSMPFGLSVVVLAKKNNQSQNK